MALTIVDRRTIFDEGDSTTGWTGGSVGTSTADFAEGTHSVTDSLATTTGQLYHTGTAINLNTTAVYVWLFNNALQGSWTTGATSLFLGDGTDQIAFHMAGGDRRIFSHDEGPVSWQCAVLDGNAMGAMDTAGETTVVAGTFAGLTKTAITEIGGHFITGSKALGGGYNVSVDIIRYGNDGIRIVDGGSGTEGTCNELAEADRSTGGSEAHGIFRRFNDISFGCQGPLTFGDNTTATDCYFEDEKVTIVFEDRNVAQVRYYFDVQGHASATNSFKLTDSVITTSGPNVAFDFNDGDIDTFELTNVQFNNVGGIVEFSNAADATGHTITRCTFDGCSVITPGDTTFTFNHILNTTAGVFGALFLNADGNDTWEGLEFTSGGGSGYGIYMDVTGSYDLDGYVFNGYSEVSLGSNLVASSGANNSMIHNNSGGLITLTILNGQNVSVRNGVSSTTVVIFGAVTVQVTVSESDGTPVENAIVFLRVSDGAGPMPFEESVTISNSGSVATVTHTAHGMETGDWTDIKGASHATNNGTKGITVTNANTYLYAIVDPGSSPTGTITSTMCPLVGATNASGVVSDTRVYATDQNFSGHTRLSTSSPLYKTGPINGTIDSTDGYTGTGILISDE